MKLTKAQYARARRLAKTDYEIRNLLSAYERDALDAEGTALLLEEVRVIMTTRKRPMKLLIWEDVLTDYTSGMACAIARTVAEGAALAPYDHIRRELAGVAPTEIIDISTASEPRFWYVYGGG